MAVLNKINQEYLMHLQEEREQLNSAIYDNLKEGKDRNLQEQDLKFLTTQIKSLAQSKMNVTMQSIINKNKQDNALLNYYLDNVFNVIKQLQSRINVAHKFQMHIQGKANRKPKSEKKFVQTFAAEVWDKDPDITREDILNRIKEIRRINAADSTILRKWFKEIDPKAKNGERRKRKSKKMTN